MAATAVYATISQIERFDGKSTLSAQVNFSNIGSTSSTFTLAGGVYSVEVVGATFGTVTLQKLSIDGSTYNTCGSAFAANGFQTLTLPPGTYKLTLA